MGTISEHRARELRQMADRLWDIDKDIAQQFTSYEGPRPHLQEAAGELHAAARALEAM